MFGYPPGRNGRHFADYIFKFLHLDSNRTNADTVYWRIYAAQGGDELKATNVLYFEICYRTVDYIQHVAIGWKAT